MTKKFYKSISNNKMFKILYKKINSFFFTLLKINLFYKFFKKKFIYQNCSFINNSTNELSRLFEKYGSDKSYPHSYSTFYYNLFDHCKNEIKLIFECGIGSNNPLIPSNMSINGKPGASLRAWRDYFVNSVVYGADIDKNILFEEDRIKTFYVDQTDLSSIENLWRNVQQNNFDLIIDDGLHTYKAASTFFESSFNNLKKGGIYIIEDVNFIYIEKLSNFLSKYNTEVIILNRKYLKNIDNNLILIRKN
jgi:hypothetical protein